MAGVCPRKSFRIFGKMGPEAALAWQAWRNGFAKSVDNWTSIPAHPELKSLRERRFV